MHRTSMIAFALLLLLLLLTGCGDPFAVGNEDPTTEVTYLEGDDSFIVQGGNPHPLGGILLVGTHSSTSTGPGFVSYLASNGQEQWRATLDYPVSGVAGTSSGQVFITGGTGELGMFVAQLSLSGAMRWLQYFTGSVGKSILPLNDGSLIVAGSTTTSGTSYPFMVAINSLGQATGGQTYASMPGTANDAVPYGNGYMIALTVNNGGLDQPALLYTDASGAAQWEYTYGGGVAGGFRTLVPTGGYVAAGGNLVSGTYNETYVILVDASGAVAWEWTWTPPTPEEVFYLQDLAVRDDGLLVLAGTQGINQARAVAMVIDAEGNPGWYRQMADIDRFSDGQVISSASGVVTMAGRAYADSDDALQDMFLMITSQDPLATD